MSPIQYEGDKEKVYSTAGRGETFAEVLARRYSRRDLVKGGVAASAIVVSAGALSSTAAQEASPEVSPVAGRAPRFTGIAASTADQLVVADGYEAIPFLKWGDPLFADSPAFDLANQSAEAQAKQFGYNCDWIGFLPLPIGSGASDHGLLIVNHEYTNPELMFPGYLVPNPLATPGNDEIAALIPSTTQAIVDTELEAHGLSIVEIQKGADGTWQVVQDSQFNRRITATTPMIPTGPAAGADLLKTSADPTGTAVIGTLNNCAGGWTPWGTVISGEENFQQYFANLGALAADDPVRLQHDRFGLNEAETERRWELFYDCFDLSREPNEPFRFGWGIEFDPYDPASTPKKRTALGRAKHEGHTSAISPSGRVTFYSGDDERFEYAYKFVTAGSYNPDDRAANMDLLDDGTLYVAKFNDDGTGEWLPLTYETNGLVESNGFTSQADVLINPRAASDVLGATKMDRPEDFEANPVSGKVYLVCTNNTNRGVEDNPGADAANPRVENAYGHIIELAEDGNDYAGTTFTWSIFLLCGVPTDESTYFAGFPKDQVTAISSPDNITFDKAGNLWISTDGQPGVLEINDAIYAVPTEGPERGHLQQFFSGIPGGEVSGPEFTPDNTALFVSIQHPGEGGTYEEPLSSWPDGAGAPRPTVVVIRKLDGGAIGG